jgi:hypothetical protein
MTTFVLTADTARGVSKVEIIDFVSEYPETEFVRARDFIDHLKDLCDGETVSALFDDLEHADFYDVLVAEYGVH